MTPLVFQEFTRILEARDVGDRVLEIGAVPTADSLLNLSVFDDCAELVGINLDGGESYTMGRASDAARYQIVKGDANEMTCFEDDSFDTVVCNSVIEHDKFFWKTIEEVRRVTRAGGLVVFASPGYDELKNVRLDGWKANLRRTLIDNLYFLFKGTTTLHVHNWPGDYYRFSPQCYREVLFKDFDGVEVYSIMIPPRVFGIGSVRK
ncbi:MAG: methyltransferase domain-containing protein [Pseudomonadota bacterium]